MYRFVDLSAAYWCDDENAQKRTCCGIIDTVTDLFLLNAIGSHVHDDIDKVREAGGARAVALVPDCFFGR